MLGVIVGLVCGVSMLVFFGKDPEAVRRKKEDKKKMEKEREEERKKME